MGRIPLEQLRNPRSTRSGRRHRLLFVLAASGFPVRLLIALSRSTRPVPSRVQQALRNRERNYRIRYINCTNIISFSYFFYEYSCGHKKAGSAPAFWLPRFRGGSPERGLQHSFRHQLPGNQCMCTPAKNLTEQQQRGTGHRKCGSAAQSAQRRADSTRVGQ